ncbi:hypothetical protein BGX23_006452 [Mortierella sp. AD031]|nr:hypothetical protein BGX23_006452 [Mortierella sp. AD031]
MHGFRYVNCLTLPSAASGSHGKAAMDAVAAFKLRLELIDDVAWAVCTLRQATSWRTMTLLEHDFHEAMELWDLNDQEEQDLFYLRDTYNKAAHLWQRDAPMGKQNNEGWLLWNLHGPLMEIFTALLNVHLRATDLKARNNINEDKHDVLVSHTIFPIDIVVVEAKRHQQKGAMIHDSDKIARTMAGNLKRTLDLLPPECRKENKNIVRSYGILNSGLRVTPLEARYIDNIPVIYYVRKFDIPKGALVCSELVSGLAVMIAFKESARRFMDLLSELKSNATPVSSPRSSSVDGDHDDDEERESTEDHID